MKSEDDQHARPTLDYPSPPPSPYDRPVEQTLRFVGQLRIVFGVLLGISVLVAVVFVVWVVMKLV